MDKTVQRIKSLCRKPRRVAGGVFLIVFMMAAVVSGAGAQQTSFGINLSGGKEPVQIEADDMEMRDKEGIAVLSGNVSVVQGDRMLRAGKVVVHYLKAGRASQAGAAGGLGSTGVDRIEVSNKVYIKSGTQVATGDEGTFDGKSNIMVLRGKKVVLVDGDNVATGCKLTAHMDTGKAFLESCSKKGRVSIIMNNK
ncbi:MAG: Lipopolysaccharide transport periplasmic protein LptA [Candidatus Tokpelaia hoelldobleri]|uniref:Lipopolysaccharide transport periplasmic protein LptA n=1 Tax=Candidatus Tokpelaia hoelldobleri TaxID=1902579 RepID=A0A1U9JSA0_9HYPH|nr:MAG: Lipopolysaccharide transport periplasmic protein LptA [Candidatus Tokpelaia hoelldoblerii]